MDYNCNPRDHRRPIKARDLRRVNHKSLEILNYMQYICTTN